MYEFQMILINEFGEFFGQKIKLNEEKCELLINISKTFYMNSGFELTCEDGSFMVFAPDVVKNSILKINRISIKIEEENV